MNFSGQHVHLLGIGGCGMSALVPLLVAVGAQVSGCDLVANATVQRLRAAKTPVALGHDPAHLVTVDVVVVSAAVPVDHPEILAAEQVGIPVMSRAVCLAALIGQRRNIAVTGAHGKTSTTWLTAHVLQAAGVSPTAMVGGSVEALGETGGVAGIGPVVAEADESDASFRHFAPHIVVLTNVDHEHLDFYGSFEGLLQAYGDWFAQADKDSVLVLGDASAPARLLARWPGEIIRVDQAGGFVQAVDIELRSNYSQARLLIAGEDVGRFRVPTPGRHMITNALAALAAAWAMTGRWLPEFLADAGRVRRRFSDHGSAAGVRIIEDYAHHPREIAAVVATARIGLSPSHCLWCLFQPHRYSRTRACLDDFAQCFTDADAVVVTGTYAAGEVALPGFGGRAIATQAERAGVPLVQYVRGPADAAAYIAGQAQPGDSVLVLGAGDVSQAVPVLQELLLVRTEQMAGEMAGEIT